MARPPLTPEEMDRLRQEMTNAVVARAASENAQMGTAPPEFVGPVAGGPAPAPPPPSPVMSGLKQAGISAAGAALGPIGQIGAHTINTADAVSRVPPPTQGPAPGSGGPNPEPPPVPSSGPTDQPLILQAPNMAPRQVSPAGMYPESMTAKVHEGRPAPPEAQAAFGAGTGLELEAARIQRDADQAYYGQVRDAQQLKMQAATDAATRHAAVQAERDSMTKERLARIEALNAAANSNIDPQKFWQDKGLFGTAMAFLGVALGGLASGMTGKENKALSVVENSINQNIQAQVANRENKAHAAQREKSLYDVHLANLGDKDAAINATKLAMWDNVAAMAEAYKAQHSATVSEANYNKLAAQILEKRGETVNKLYLQSTPDVSKEYGEKWHAAQYAGGGAGGSPAGKMEGYELIPVPASDRTTEKDQLIAVPKGAHKELGSIVGATNTIVGINQEALERIKQIRKDAEYLKRHPTDSEAMQRFNSNRKMLVDLGQRKASYLSSSEGQGVLKEQEFARAMEDRVLFNDWWKAEGVIEKRIQAQNNSLTGAAGRMVQGYGGQHVQMAYTRDRNGALQPTPLFTGQLYKPPPVGPEMGPVGAPKEK